MLSLKKISSKYDRQEKVLVQLELLVDFDKDSNLIIEEFISRYKSELDSLNKKVESSATNEAGQQRINAFNEYIKSYTGVFDEIYLEAKKKFEFRNKNKWIEDNIENVKKQLVALRDNNKGTHEKDNYSQLPLSCNAILKQYADAITHAFDVNYKTAKALQSNSQVDVLVDPMGELDFEIINVGGRKSSRSIVFSEWSDSLRKRVKKWLKTQDDIALDHTKIFQKKYSSNDIDLISIPVSEFSARFLTIINDYEKTLNPNSPLMNTLIKRHLGEFEREVIPRMEMLNKAITKRMDEFAQKAKITTKALYYFNEISVKEFLKMKLEELVMVSLQSTQDSKLPLNGIMSISNFMSTNKEAATKLLRAGEASIAKEIEGKYTSQKAIVVRALERTEMFTKTIPLTHEYSGIIAPNDPLFALEEFHGKAFLNTTRVGEKKKNIVSQVDSSSLFGIPKGSAGSIVIPLDYRIVIYRGTKNPNYGK